MKFKILNRENIPSMRKKHISYLKKELEGV